MPTHWNYAGKAVDMCDNIDEPQRPSAVACELAQWLRTLAALQEDQSSIPSSHLGSSLLYLILAPGGSDILPLLDWGSCTNGKEAVCLPITNTAAQRSAQPRGEHSSAMYTQPPQDFSWFL